MQTETAFKFAVSHFARRIINLTRCHMNEDLDANGEILLTLVEHRDAVGVLWARIWQIDEANPGFADAIYIEMDTIGLTGPGQV